jgi:exopolyphosphatase/guanosine-5'-triphosphate,3'-diphosphate pyrophosphatase
MPLGAARLAREHLAEDRSDETIRRLRKKIRADIARDAGDLLRQGTPDHAVATSKTFRSLARICGAAPSGDGPLVERSLPADVLADRLPKLAVMSPEELGELPGVSPSRVHQILPGALVALAVMDIFDLPALEICPWALREGVILERIDAIRRSASGD